MIEDKLSDQGPWGGSRWIHWVAHDAETFTPADAMKFAAEHGWKCGEVVEYSAERMRCWKSLASRPVFPLFFGEPTATALNLNHEFPRHIEGIASSSSARPVGFELLREQARRALLSAISK
jgi:hypothetical protein